jgi:phage-related protein
MGLGIYNKLSKFFNWAKDKAVNTAILVIGKINDLINSKAVSGVVNYAAPLLNSIYPALGTGIQAALPMVQNFSQSLNNQAQKFGNMIQPTRNVKHVIGLARRPDEIHPRLELKGGSGTVFNRNGSYAEVLDTPD